MRTAVILATILLAATTVAAQPAADLVRFAADAEKARGHLLVSEQLYMLGQARGAALHAAHPVQELGNKIFGPVRRVDPARADALRETLKEPGRAIETKVPPAQYVALVAKIAKALDDAVARVVGDDARAASFKSRVIAALLEAVAEEYDESFKEGRITQLVEYQDAYGFFRRAKTLYDALPVETRRADADMTSLAKTFPSSREPPKSPMPAKDVKALTQRIGSSLTK